MNSIELFAGCGGMALGIERAGFDHVLLNECDRAACETLRLNRPGWDLVECDVAAMSYSSWRDRVDLLTGGFPCQAFSYAGKQLGFNDVRGTLFFEFARAVNEVRPRLFIAENVRGLFKHDGGKTLATMVSILEEQGYRVEHKLLNAVDYGVPQKRERLFIVGIRNDLPGFFPWPNPYAGQRLTMADALRGVPASAGLTYSEAKAKVLALVPPGGCWRDLPADVQAKYMGAVSLAQSGGKTGMARRLSWGEPSLTLLCSPSQKQTERCHPSETRPLTVREYARIQTFPDGWEFCGSVASQYKQIGNAVPVELAYQIGVSAAMFLQGVPVRRVRHQLSLFEGAIA